MLQLENSTVIGVRLWNELKAAVQQDAKRSGWSISEQIRYELAHPRGLWKDQTPCLPKLVAAGKR